MAVSATLFKLGGCRLGFHPEQPNHSRLAPWTANRRNGNTVPAQKSSQATYSAEDELNGERPGFVTITINQCPFYCARCNPIAGTGGSCRFDFFLNQLLSVC